MDEKRKEPYLLGDGKYPKSPLLFQGIKIPSNPMGTVFYTMKDGRRKDVEI